ncbi:hypothetical protein Tco_0708268 [Tanacetum coccineum]
MMIEEPSAEQTGAKRRRSGKEPASQCSPSETTTSTAGKTTESCRPESYESGVQDNKPKKRSTSIQTDFKNLRDYLLLIMHGILRRDDDALYKFKEGDLDTDCEDPNIEGICCFLLWQGKSSDDGTLARMTFGPFYNDCLKGISKEYLSRDTFGAKRRQAKCESPDSQAIEQEAKDKDRIT